MINKSNKLSLGTAVLFELILISTAMVNASSGQWKSLNLTFLAIISLFLPFIFTRLANAKNIVLPSNFQVIMLVFIFFAQYFGEIKNYYLIFWWWDLLLHAIFGSYAVIIALCSIKGIIRKKPKTTQKRFTLFSIVFAFSITNTLGVMWGIFEFAGDYFFKTNMVKGGLEDTITDLLVKVLAAFITSLICYFFSLKEKSFISNFE